MRVCKADSCDAWNAHREEDSTGGEILIGIQLPVQTMLFHLMMPFDPAQVNPIYSPRRRRTSYCDSEHSNLGESGVESCLLY